MRLGVSLVLLLCIGLGACGLKIDPEIDATAREAYRQIGDNNPKIDGLLAPEMKVPAVKAALPKVRSYIPREAPSDINAVQWDIFYPSNGDDVTAIVRHAYRFEGRRALVTTTLRRPPATHDWKVSGFKVWVATDKELSVNRLTLMGKTPSHYVFLVGMVLSPILMIGAVWELIAMGGRKRRFWWIIPSVIGVVTIRMNWTTGAVSFLPFNFQVLGAGATTVPTGFDPWMLSFSLPVVALLVLFGVIGRARSRPVEET